jgi:hypothetical protein
MNERVQGNDVYNNAGTVPLSASIDFKNVSLSDPKTSVATGVTIPVLPPVNNITGLDRNNYSSPRSTQFSIGVQQAIGRSVLSASYVGTQNRHQNYYSETNLAPQGLLPSYVTGSNTVPYNAVVPYVGYHSVEFARNEANGDYNSFQVAMRGSLLNNDLTYQVGYTYSHTNDSFNYGSQSSAGDLYQVGDPYLGWKYDFGPSPFDRRNVFFTNFVYQIPLFKNNQNHMLKMTLGGWEISGIVTAESGAPLNITLGGHSVSSIVPNTLNRPDLTSTSLNNPHTVAQWFDTSVFAVPAPGTWGNTPHDYVRGPGRQNWNLSLFKNFVFSETRGSNLQFRAEFFNIWNHPQWIGDLANGGISTSKAASNFGAVTNAYDPRIIQLALKLTF